MSINMGAYLVNWDEFQEKARHVDAYDALEDEDRQALPDESARAPGDFMEAFDKFKRSWKSDSKLWFKEVFDTTFSFSRGGADQIMELEEGESEESNLFGIDTALKPETVKELVASFSELDLEERRPLFEKHVAGTYRFNTFGEWKAYGEEWLTMLRRAADQGRGFILANFGWRSFRRGDQALRNPSSRVSGRAGPVE